MPSHHDTDYVSYKSKTTGKKFEVFTKPQKAMEWRNTRKAKAAAEGSGGQREGGADTAAVLAQACVYRDVKKLKVASAGELMAEFGTEDALEAAAFILEKGKLRVKVYIRRPVMELTLDAVFAMETVTALYTCYHKEGVLPKFLAACIMVAIVVTLTMTLCRTCGRWLSTRMLPQPPFNDPLSEDTVLRQFQTQMWQLIAHVTMSAFGLYAYLDGDDFLEHPARLMQPWQVTKPIRPAVENLYIVQLAIWFVTLFFFRFLEVPAGDYHVMYTHHVVTIGVVTLSYAATTYVHFGLVVFLLHDLSDVPLDIMKLFSLLRLEESHGWYLSEITYVIFMPIWIYTRNYVFPVKLIYYGVWGTMYGTRDPHGEEFWCHGLREGSYKQVLLDQDQQRAMEQELSVTCTCCGGLAAWALLCTLEVLHVWWTYLLLRIGYNGLFLGVAVEDVKAVYYDAEPTNKDKATTTTTNKKKTN